MPNVSKIIDVVFMAFSFVQIQRVTKYYVIWKIKLTKDGEVLMTEYLEEMLQKQQSLN